MLLDKVLLKILIFDSMTYQIVSNFWSFKNWNFLKFFEMIIFKWKPEMTQKWLKGTKMFTRSWQPMTGGIFSPVLHDLGFLKRSERNLSGSKTGLWVAFFVGLRLILCFSAFAPKFFRNFWWIWDRFQVLWWNKVAL